MYTYIHVCVRVRLTIFNHCEKVRSCQTLSWKVFHHLSWTPSTVASASAAMGRWICGWSADG